jgi:hypothetical protein
MLNGGVLSWKSKRQNTVSLSNAESEYIAASKCSQEILYVQEILRGFNCKQKEPTVLFEDNLASIAMSQNQVHRERSKHINVRKYFVRDLVEAGVLKLYPCGTKDMVADALTKSLAYPAFSAHRALMLGENSALKEQLVFVRSGGAFGWYSCNNLWICHKCCVRAISVAIFSIFT